MLIRLTTSSSGTIKSTMRKMLVSNKCRTDWMSVEEEWTQPMAIQAQKIGDNSRIFENIWKLTDIKCLKCNTEHRIKGTLWWNDIYFIAPLQCALDSVKGVSCCTIENVAFRYSLNSTRCVLYPANACSVGNGEKELITQTVECMTMKKTTIFIDVLVVANATRFLSCYQ